MFKIAFQILDFISVLKVSKISINNMKSCITYEDTINALNGIVSNAEVLAKPIDKSEEAGLKYLVKNKIFFERAGVKLDNINKLRIVHIAGTKGKGSTSTYIDSVLHKKGYKTGLYTSPHLTEVRERIKINGTPIPKPDFIRYFWDIYNQLKTSSDEMPFYFQFLTIMAFHVFIEEKVDYVILETGIGGRFDNTNIIQSPKVACITSLGFDHVDILGNTIKEIAWNKAGIIKSGSLVVTSKSQPDEGLETILEEVKLHNNKLFLVPVNNDSFMKDGRNVYPENASLASVVCDLLLNTTELSINHTGRPCKKYGKENIIDVPLEYSTESEFKEIIYKTIIRGRYETIQKGNIEYYIDGAHTVESIKTCVTWFQEASANKPVKNRFLIFMITGPRSVEDLLKPLTDIEFDGILLAPLVPFINNRPLDFAIKDQTIEKEKAKLSEIGKTWLSLNNRDERVSAEYFNSFEEIDNWLAKKDGSIQVLVTGSLHLVGCALAVVGHPI